MTQSPSSNNPSDESLVDAGLAGDREAVDTLISRYQGWVYNLAVRILWNQDAAADATQEIFICMVTHLSSFEKRSAFKTWLYRVAANHLLMWNRKSKAETAITGFECYRTCLAEMPDSDEAATSPEYALVVEEARIGCMMGMLLCLTREQRLVYVLGEIFEVGDKVGAAVLDLSPANFRQKLKRARFQLHTFLQGNCGLVNPDNACRCTKKTAGFIQTGIVNPSSLQFVDAAVSKAADIAKQNRSAFGSLVEQGIGHLYRLHPTLLAPDMVSTLRTLIRHDEFQSLLDLTPPK